MLSPLNFDLSEEQESLREAVRTVLARECPVALARDVVENGTVADALWRDCVELGWPALTIPEASGGLGLGAVELALVSEELGRALVPGPLFATLTQFIPFVREAGSAAQQRALLEPVARGERTGTLATAGGVSARRDGASWRLAGSCRFVIDGAMADEIGVVASVESGDGVALFVVPRESVQAKITQALDATRPVAEVAFDGVTVDAQRTLGEPGTQSLPLERILQEAVLGLASDAVGACHALFDRTLAYAKEREQFGQPIGAFQALQHRFADMFIAIEKARSCCAFAAMTLDEDDPRRGMAVSMAKATAGDCQRFVGQQGIQIHGGIGYTWESDVHLFVKRAATDDALLGNAAEHRARVAGLLSL